MAASISLIIVSLFLSFAISIAATNKGFSVELIHRDSPKSPFYNPNETSTQRLVNALRRSFNRMHRFRHVRSGSPTEESEVVANNGEYLMSIFVGTPPKPIHAIADTGSDLIWTQCKPCEGCYKQVDPLFDPKISSTYRDLSCSSSQCQVLDQTSCSGSGSSGTCQYSYSYGDGSSTEGNVAVETIGLNSTNGRVVTFPKSIFGCGHSNSGTFDEKGSGIIGLGGGPVSLIRQMGTSISGKFSYCLVPLTSETDKSSTLNFGSSAVVSGNGAQSTPLVSKDPDTFYYLTLEAISVGNKKIKFPSSSSGTTEGNIIIDSGTTLTLVPHDFFNDLATAVDNVVGGKKVNDPSGELSLCYSTQPKLHIPTITAHFTGADVILDPSTIFIPVNDTAVCFTFGTIDSGAIFGNLAQSNLLVGYDLQKKTVSFKPFDCEKA